MYEFISIYWPVIPSIIAVASIIAKITPNKTDDKIVNEIKKVVDFLSLAKKVK